VSTQANAYQAVVGGSNPENVTLRELRRMRGLSLRDVERSTGIYRGQLSTIERGISIPSPATLQTLSELYGVPFDSWKVVVEYVIAGEAVA